MAVAFRRFAIVGCGLIGGSIELAIRERLHGADVIMLDRGDDLAAVSNADLVILSAPICANIRILPFLRPHLASHAVVTDTGSTKATIVGAAAGMRFVGGHPIAGAATSGRAASRADLFSGRPWLLTPRVETLTADVEHVRDFAEALGASVRLVDADEHDRLFAWLSHLPQLAISTLMHLAGSAVGADRLTLAGPGLRDSTRLASSPPEIWRDILQTNHGNIASSLDALIAVLGRLRDDPSGEVLTEIFESAVAWKRVLDDAGGGGLRSGETK